MGNLRLGILFLRLSTRAARDHIGILLLFHPIGHQWDGHAVAAITDFPQEVCLLNLRSIW